MATEVSTAWTDEDVEKTVTKLLDKAGHDPRVTPRILREKAEQRMNLAKGDLKSKRENIKVIICDWWQKRKSAEVDRETANFKALVRLARVSGNVPHLVKGISEMATTNEKIVALRDRLRAKGLKFSDVPTEAETEAAEKAYLLKKDLDGIDPALIVSTSRTGKRPLETAPSSSSSASASASGSGSAAQKQKVEVKSEPGVSVKNEPGAMAVKTEGAAVKVEGDSAVAAAPVKARVKAEYSDEEAEF